MMKKVALFILAFVIVLPLNTASAQSGGYLAIMGGYTFGADAQLEWNDIKIDDIDIKNTWIIGAKVGYTSPQFKYLSTELEFFYLNPDINRTVRQSGSNSVATEGDLSFYNIMFNLLARYPEGRIHPYIGGGVGISVAHLSLTTNATIGGVTDFFHTNEDATALGWQLLAGIEFDISREWSADLGYRYFGAKPSFDDLGDSEIDYKTSIGTFALKYKF